MGESTQASLWRGYTSAPNFRGTLTASTVKKLVFPGHISTVSVHHQGAVANDIYFTIDATTTPTVDGTGDNAGSGTTPQKMYRVKNGEVVSFDAHVKEVWLISAGAADYQVIGLKD